MEKKDGYITINDGCTDCGKCIDACDDGILRLKETGFRVLIGGKKGSTVRFGIECTDFVDDLEVMEIIERTLNSYQKKVALREGSRKKKERLGEVVERLGLDSFMS